MRVLQPFCAAEARLFQWRLLGSPLIVPSASASASALEIASLGDAFAAAVDAFGANNTQMAERLQTIERALEKSLLRSDEQLAYYVAQAREVVDLSLLAQRQIVDDLRQLEVQRGALSVA